MDVALVDDFTVGRGVPDSGWPTVWGVGEAGGGGCEAVGAGSRVSAAVAVAAIVAAGVAWTVAEGTAAGALASTRAAERQPAPTIMMAPTTSTARVE